jgi:putative ABC transport system ATP-binding protein
MISLQGVTKRYRSHSQDIQALGRTDLEIQAGEFVIIVGRSGAGKSTLLGTAGGLLSPSSGEVWLQNQSLWSLDEKTRAQIRAQQIGFVFQNASVVNSLSLLENVMLPTLFVESSPSRAQARALGLLDRIGLKNRAHARPDQVSGGEKRRVAVASALMNEPTLLLADEPTGELDPDTEGQIMALLKQTNEQGTTILLVTHDRHLTDFASRVLSMEQGQLQETDA